MTDNIIIKKVEKELVVNFSGKKELFSEESKSKIQENWNSKNSESNFFNGKMYTIANIHEEKHKIVYAMNETDYAHYLYTDEYNDIDELCKIIFVSVVLYSSDNKFILGKIAETTASPGRIQCIGGNIDENSLIGDNFDITKTILQEIQEETGLLVEERDVKLSYIKVDNDNKYTALIFETYLKEDSSSIDMKFRWYQNELQKNKIISELSELIYVNNDTKSINQFCIKEAKYLVDYLPKLLTEAQKN